MDNTDEDILESRIAAVERKIFGLNTTPNVHDPLPETNIIDSLSHLQTLIASALSGRDKFNNLIQMLPEIEKYLESDSELINLQTDVKLEYILTLEPLIRENIKQFKQISELQLVFNSDYFKNIPEMSEKLQHLTLEYTKLSEQVEEFNVETKELLSRYNEIIMNISKVLIVMDAEVTKLEKAAESKEIVD